VKFLLKLYNTLTRRLEVFKPLEKRKVKLVTCGPSIYQLPHIGNYRTFVVEDILQRYLEYLGYEVTRLINITDVEDKALTEIENRNITLKELTDGNIKTFINELKKLKVKIPNHLERSSLVVEKAVHLIELLLEKGYAYRHTYRGRRNVYFDPLKFDGFGKLYGLDMSKWPKKKRRFHRDTYPNDRWNKGDFILWHGYKEGDKAYWDTKIGKGRPSWNIQDQAMLLKTFGLEADIWFSGIDSTHRHHDYIIATIEAITGKPVVSYWLHSAHLVFEGEKMSKRKGNIKYTTDLLETECIWNHIRFFFIYGHYRQKLNFTFEGYNKVCNLLKSFRKMVKKLNQAEDRKQKSNAKAKNLVEQIKTDFEEKMNNDLQVKAAFDSVYDIVSRLVKLKVKEKLSTEDSNKALAKLKDIDYVLQAIF
jgi:cysteinyl-tRNA synthetase